MYRVSMVALEEKPSLPRAVLCSRWIKMNDPDRDDLGDKYSNTRSTHEDRARAAGSSGS